jgi:hypothetical protein
LGHVDLFLAVNIMPAGRAIHVVSGVLAALMYISACTAGPTKGMSTGRAGNIGVFVIVVVGAKFLGHTNPLAVSGIELKDNLSYTKFSILSMKNFNRKTFITS